MQILITKVRISCINQTYHMFQEIFCDLKIKFPSREVIFLKGKNSVRKISFFTRCTPERCRVAALASCSTEHAEWRGARAFTSESTSFVNPPLESSHLVGFQRFVRYAEGLSSLFSLSPAWVYIGISAHSIMGIIKEMGWVPVGSPGFIRRSAKRRWKGKNCTRERETGTSLRRWWRRFRRVRLLADFGGEAAGCRSIVPRFIYSIFLGDIRRRDSFYIQFRDLQ